MDDLGDHGLAKMAGTVAGVFIVGDASSQFLLGIFGGGLELRFPGFDDVRGERVGQAEGDGLDGTTLVAVRKVTALVVTLGFHRAMLTEEVDGTRVFSSPRCREPLRRGGLKTRGPLCAAATPFC